MAGYCVFAGRSGWLYAFVSSAARGECGMYGFILNTIDMDYQYRLSIVQAFGMI